ncbi:MAG: prepilin-type N-terminal cleavage/methylation domain-containing protein [Rhodobacteraceae bacterium]|nr:prepilin-type N-terminal cleavage/methylation domain-containing protein [Paracoccaceae bacterium]
MRGAVIPRNIPPRGLTLIELVVAITILSIASVAAWRTFDQAAHGTEGQHMRALAHQVALNRAAELRALGLDEGRDLPATVEMARAQWQITVSEAVTRGALVQVRLTATAQSGEGADLVVYLPREMPDVWGLDP